MEEFKQQIANVLTSINSRNIVELSVSPESSDRAIKGQFKTQEGENFSYELTQQNGEYSLSEVAIQD